MRFSLLENLIFSIWIDDRYHPDLIVIYVILQIIYNTKEQFTILVLLL